MKIHCIGNSHLNNFSFTAGCINFDHSLNKLFKFFHMGPTIAYNFYEHHFQRFKSEYLHKIKKEEDYIIFVIGEVDCRVHLPKQADEQNKTDDEIVKECVDRFNRIYDELPGYKIIIFSTHPTTTDGHHMSGEGEMIYGSCERRNKICVLWNKHMREFSEKRGYPYLSFYEDMVDENNITKMEYFFDYCHLNNIKIKPLMDREFKKIGIDIWGELE